MASWEVFHAVECLARMTGSKCEGRWVMSLSSLAPAWHLNQGGSLRHQHQSDGWFHMAWCVETPCCCAQYKRVTRICSPRHS